jgi:hypothetical protein
MRFAMKNRILVTAVCMIFVMPIHARNLNEIMPELGEKMLVLLPELYSDDSSVENIQRDIVILADLLAEAEEHFVDSDPAVKATYSMLREQLNQTADFSAKANIEMLRADLAESYALCATCHNQDRKFVINYGVSKIRDMDEFIAAEYSYITRDYESALTSYNNSLKDSNDSERIQKALDRMLVITLEVSADPQLALETLSSARKVLVAGNRDTEDLDEWLKVIERLALEPKSTQSPLTADSIEEIDNYLENEWPAMQVVLGHNEQTVHWIAIRGRLHYMLRTFPESPETPRLLYWLALSDRALHYRFYDSLSRRYLVRCIRDYPKHDIAQECFKEYEMLMIVSFSGSGGIYLPMEAQQEISELRRLVYTP